MRGLGLSLGRLQVPLLKTLDSYSSTPRSCSISRCFSPRGSSSTENAGPTSLNSANAFVRCPIAPLRSVALRRILLPTIKFSTWREARMPLKLDPNSTLPSIADCPPKTRQPPVTAFRSPSKLHHLLQCPMLEKKN